MRAGEAINKAISAAGRAIGPLTYMYVKGMGSRSMMEQAALDLEEAAAFIRSALPAPLPPQYPETSPGEDSKE